MQITHKLYICYRIFLFLTWMKGYLFISLRKVFLFLLASCLYSLLFILFKFLRTPLKLAFYGMNYFTLTRHLLSNIC